MGNDPKLESAKIKLETGHPNRSELAIFDAETENYNTVHPTGDSTNAGDGSDENDIDVQD